MNDEMPTTSSYATQRKCTSMLEVAYLNDKSTCHFLGMGEENVTKTHFECNFEKTLKERKRLLH